MVFVPPSIQDSTRVADFSGRRTVIIKRPIQILDDGTAVAVIFQQNWVGSIYGTDDDNMSIQIWHSPVDRSTWTLKATYVPPDPPIAEDELDYVHAGAALLNDGSVFVVWRSTDYIVRAAEFPKTAVASWSVPSGYETVFTPVGRFPHRFDLDVHRPTDRVFIGWHYRGLNSATDTIGSDIIVRTSPGVYDFIAGAYDLGGNSQSKVNCEDFTMAIDPASTADYARVVFCVAVVSTTKDYGDYIGWRVVRISDNVATGSGTVRSNISAGRADSRRANWLFASDSAEWSLVGVGGIDSGSEGWAYRFKSNSSVSSTSQSWSTVAPLSYTPQKFSANRTLSLHTDVAVTYANDKFNFLWHDSSYAFNMTGKFVDSKVVFQSGTYPWDNRRTYNNTSTAMGSAPASAIFGGARDADSVDKFDTLILYFSRTSPTTKDSGWFHQWNQPSRAPANVLPALNSVASTSLPTLEIFADLDQAYARTAIRPKWQIAKDAAFTISLIEHQSATGVTVNGTNVPNSFRNIAESLPIDKALASGSWYIRAAHLDEFDTLGAWTTAQQFSVLHAPMSQPISPVSGETFQYGTGDVTFAWVFSDGYIHDNQTAYRILIETNEEVPSVVVDTGKIESSEVFAIANIPDTAKNVQLRWSVQLWDVDDTAGNFSDYALFMVADPPVIEITHPLGAAVIDNARPHVTWTYADPTDSVQVAYKIVILLEGVAILDSGWRNGSETVFQESTALLANESSYSIILYVRNSIALEASTSVSFTTQWIAPAQPNLGSLAVDTTHYDERDSGYVLVTWNNQVADDEFLSWRLYRRYKLSQSSGVSDPGLDWELVHEEFSVSPPLDAPAYVYLDYLAPSNYDVHYLLTQTVMRFGSIVESQEPVISDLGKMVHLYSGAYWLIDPEADGDPEDVIRLSGASADSYTDEYESETFHVIGRGRHVEIGDRLGYGGSLDVPLRFIAGSDSLDGPRRQKLDLERFKSKRKAVYLRTPFGDIFMVNTGDITFTRVPGVGSSEFIDVSIPYAEVFK